MNKANLKVIIIPIIIVTIITTIGISIITRNQYIKINQIVNGKIAIILEKIKETNLDIDNREIIEILNSDNREMKYEQGIHEIEKYGIDINNINSIKIVQEQMDKNMKLNIAIILLFDLFWIIIVLAYFKQRNKKICQITEYINNIRNKNYMLDIEENSEDELSNLKNELYKITVMLKEESENSKKDKANLKIAVENISHQLKTPLTSISIMLDNIKENPNMEDIVKQRFIFEISKQIEWINWLVISMLKLSKLDVDVIEFYPEKINVTEFISDIISSLEIPIEIKNQKVISKGNSDVTFFGDYKWQKEAVTNIIKNCIEHNRQNGCIFINYEENNFFTKISIKDEGEGIEKEDLRHIFERFYKGKNSSENSVGIGLALAKSIVEKDNGMINCNSNVGKGTEFVVKYMKK